MFKIQKIKNINRKAVLITVLSLVVAAEIFICGLNYGKSQVNCYCQPEEVDMSLFWQTWNAIEEKYVDKNNLDIQKIIYGAIGGMVDSLGDPYTTFFTPEDSKNFKDDVKGSFEGVEMEVGIRNGQLQVVAPLEDTPAQRAGLRAGDKILEVEGTSTAGMSTDEAVSLIKGEKGTSVTLLISRDDWSESKEITIVRDLIKVPSLALEIKEIDGEKIAYLSIYQFSENTAYNFNSYAYEIMDSGANKIILDLRDNPGGYLEVAQAVAGWFLEKGNLVVTEDFSDDEEDMKYLSEGPASFSDYPVVVLINGGSASASEILAGALRDDRNILLVGEKSFGKGSVQELLDLDGGSSVKITIAKWLTPSGISISDVGLEPDIEITITDEDIEQGKDLQLEKAIEIIKGL
jgi:carboxyl-terminal processing protease